MDMAGLIRPPGRVPVATRRQPAGNELRDLVERELNRSVRAQVLLLCTLHGMRLLSACRKATVDPPQHSNTF